MAALASYIDQTTSSSLTFADSLYIMNTSGTITHPYIVQNNGLKIETNQGTIKVTGSGSSSYYTSAIKLKYDIDTPLLSDGYVINTPNIYLETDTNITWASYGSSDSSYYYGNVVKLTPEQLKRIEFINRIKTVMVNTRSYKSLGGISENTPEGRARSLLREMIGHQEFARYLRRGSLTVVGNSGLHYVIYGNTIRVFAKTITGKLKFVESICIVFKNHESLPPTDHVIMRKMMIEADEFGLRSVGNKSPQSKFDDVEPSVRKILEARKVA
jgi:hypothetical protein